MWVRSQSKLVVGNYNEFRIIVRNEISVVGSVAGFSEEEMTLGKYSTEEKAIKVMNMLEEHIDKSNCWFDENKYTPRFAGEICTQKQMVFQFPTDAEVQ